MEVASSTVTTLQSDADFAAELKVEARTLLEQVGAVMDKAKARGMSMNFQLANNEFGKTAIQALSVVKPL